MAEKRQRLTPYQYVQNNPLMMTDPDGMLDGDYYDSNGKWLYNDGIDDKKVYTVYKVPINPLTNNFSYFDIKYEGKVSKTHLSYTGSANPKNPKLSEGNLKVIQVLENSKEFTRMEMSAVGGPWGNGSPENGNYIVNTLLNRGPKGLYNEGMTKDGIGFSLNLDPQFKTGRKNLRIHPDGGKYFGTKGCIGLTDGKSQLIMFRDLMQDILSKQNNIPLNINILNNPNNNGYGKKIKSHDE